MFDIESLKYEDAAGMVPAVTADTKQLGDYLRGDLWRSGLGYDGPMPQPGPNYAADVLVLKRSFVPVPKLQEVLRRHVRGVVGKEPSFEIVPKDSGDEVIETPDSNSVNSAQGQWWDEADVMDGGGCLTLIQLFTAHLRAYGRACLRFDVPPGYVVDGVDRVTGEATQGIDAGEFEEAMSLIFAEVPNPGAASVQIDPVSRRRVAVYLYEETIGTEYSIVTRTATNTKKIKCAQVSYLGEPGSDEDGQTIVRVLRENGQNERTALDCGGQLLVLEAKLPPLLATVFFSESMRMLQERLNGVSTMIKVNANVAGFPERVGIDLEKPTVLVPDSASDGGTKEEAVPLATGPRTAPFLTSLTDVEPASGQTTVRSGTMLFRSPVSSEPLRDDAKFFEELIYAATHQRHLSKFVSADASGEALIQWMADYADSLLETRPFVEKILRAFLKGTACLAAFLSGDNAKLELCRDARWRVDCQINVGPLSADMRRVLAEEYKAGLRSRETMMIMLGTEDVEAEIAKIEAEEMKRELGDGFVAEDEPANDETPPDDSVNPEDENPTPDEE